MLSFLPQIRTYCVGHPLILNKHGLKSKALGEALFGLLTKAPLRPSNAWMEHSGHHHHNNSRPLKEIRFAFGLNLFFAVVEFIGGTLIHSSAIKADALHDFGDALALGLAMIFESKAKKGPNQKFSYGLRRLSLLSALISAIILILGSVYIFFEALTKFNEPRLPDANGMIYLALIGMAVNGYGALRLKKGATQNEKVLSWHFVEDLLGWGFTLLGAILIRLTGFSWIDPLLAVLLALIIVQGTLRNLWHTLELLLQGIPRNLDISELKREVEKLDGIREAHHFHLWTLDGEHHVMTLHIKLEPGQSHHQAVEIKQKIRKLFKNNGEIHSTIEVELAEEELESPNCS